MATLIALREGMGHPAFGVAVTLAFIVVIDANSLRQHVGRQAAAINRLAGERRQPHGCANAWAIPLVEIGGGRAPALPSDFGIFACSRVSDRTHFVRQA